MRFKLNIKSFYRKKLFPFFLLAFLFDLNFYKNVGLANVELRPASEEDINLYVNMSASYVCLASVKEIDFDFDKSMQVAVGTFMNVVQGKHKNKVIDMGSKEKKEITVEPKVLARKASISILGRATLLCPDNIPEKTKKELEKIAKQRQTQNSQKN